MPRPTFSALDTLTWIDEQLLELDREQYALDLYAEHRSVETHEHQPAVFPTDALAQRRRILNAAREQLVSRSGS